MKLYELFWPADMRKQVKRLREEGHLNEQAVKHFNKKLYQMLAIFIVISGLLIFVGGPIAQRIGYGIILLCPLFSKFDLWNLYRKQYAPYLYGARISVISTAMYVTLYGTQVVKYQLSANDKKIHQMLINFSPRIPKKDYFRKGECFDVFKSNECHAMPDISYLKRHFSLTTRVLGD